MMTTRDFTNLSQEEFDQLSTDELIEYFNWKAESDSAPEPESDEEAEAAAPAPVAPVAAPAPVTLPLPLSVEENASEAAPEAVFGKIQATDKIEEALAFGGLDYEVETFPIKPVISGIGQQDGSPEPEEDWMIPVFVGIRRQDDRKAVFAVVQNTYKIFQNREIFEYINPLLEATGGEFTRVGTIFGGARVFAFITLRDKIQLPGGAHLNQELVITSSHDGSRCLSVRTAATLDNGTIISQGRAYDLRHTRNVHLRTKEVVSILEIGSTFFGDLAEKVKKLSDLPMSFDEAETFLKKYLDFPDQKDLSVQPSKVEAKDALLKGFREAVAGGNSRLAMVLAIAHYESNVKPVRETRRFRSEAESRFRSMLNGTSGQDVESVWIELLKEDKAQTV